MKDIVATIVGFIGFFGLMAISILVLGFYAAAFADGAEEWFGWSGWWTSFLFVAIVFFLRGWGLLFGMIVGGYGAFYVWDWSLWVVVPVFFPGIAFMLGGVIAALIGGIIERMTTRQA